MFFFYIGVVFAVIVVCELTGSERSFRRYRELKTLRPAPPTPPDPGLVREAAKARRWAELTRGR